MTYELLIQIINYNTKKYLEVCLESLFQDLENSQINYKVIVLDNNSSDVLDDLEQKFKTKNISFCYSKTNLGFGGGHNYISSMEESKFTLILNSDIKFIQKNSVKELYKQLKNFNVSKVIGPRLLVEDLSQQPFDHGELYGLIAWIKNNYGASYWKQRNGPVEAAWVSGAAFMIETKLFYDLGGFDDKFFLYKEEEDLCKRVRHTGVKILYYPCVSVMHYGHVVAKRSEYFSESMNYYINKHYKKNLIYKILNGVKVFRDLIIYGKVKERL